MRILLFVFVSSLLLACARTPPPVYLEVQKSNTESLLIGLHALSAEVVWACGTEGTLIRTVNGGQDWQSYLYEKADSLQFRDIHGFNENEAAVLSIGEGALSQIFHFSLDSGWTQTFQMSDSSGFLDGLDFWNDSIGLAYGDAIDSLPYLLKTVNGGKTWQRITSNLPRAGRGEGGFAASGTLIEMGEKGKAWVGTGAGGNARILYTNNYGETWTSLPTPMTKGEAAGITTVRFIGNVGFIAGGDLTKSEAQQDHLFFSDTRGNSWYPAGKPKTPGAIYGSGFARINDRFVTIICGPEGADVSIDMGQNWTKLTPAELWTCELLSSGEGWLMGDGGRVFKVVADF